MSKWVHLIDENGTCVTTFSASTEADAFEHAVSFARQFPSDALADDEFPASFSPDWRLRCILASPFREGEQLKLSQGDYWWEHERYYGGQDLPESALHSRLGLILCWDEIIGQYYMRSHTSPYAKYQHSIHHFLRPLKTSAVNAILEDAKGSPPEGLSIIDTSDIHEVEWIPAHRFCDFRTIGPTLDITEGGTYGLYLRGLKIRQDFLADPRNDGMFPVEIDIYLCAHREIEKVMAEQVKRFDPKSSIRGGENPDGVFTREFFPGDGGEPIPFPAATPYETQEFINNIRYGR